MIKQDYLNGWTYHPEFSTADTTSLYSDLHTSTSSNTIASEINKKVREICREHEARSVGVSFINLEKELKEFGIELSTIRHSSGEIEIEGYFRPDIYKIYRAKEMCSVPITPRKPRPKKVIFSGPATTIIWKDGTKTTVKCQEGDEWAPDVGIAMCYLKKMLGNKGNYNKIFYEARKLAVFPDEKKEAK